MALALTGCGGSAPSTSATQNPPAPAPIDAGAPIANAGADRSAAAGATVTLDGSASGDPRGVIELYQWSQTAGPEVALSLPSSVTTTFTAPRLGAPSVLTFELKVTDNEGHMATDSVDVAVTPDFATPEPQVPVPPEPVSPEPVSPEPEPPAPEPPAPEPPEPPVATALSFEDVTTLAEVGAATRGGHGAMFSDIDGDSLPDLYVTMNFPGTLLAELFHLGLGAGRFREEAGARGIANVDSGSHGSVWADLDNDGDLDLFNGSFEQNRLYRNDGTGFFTDITGAAGLPARAWPTRAVVAFDMDNDGDLDLFAVNGHLGNDDPVHERNEVYRNDGNGSFTSIESGALYTARAGQGATAVDFDNDGDVDVFAANRTGPVAALRNDGGGAFTEIDAVALGLEPEGRDGVSFADVNNDGHLDVLLGQALYLHDGVSSYVRRQAFDTSTYHYMGGFADLDNDGDFDVVFPGADRVQLNDGAGSFSAGDPFVVGEIADPRSVSFADVDQDGDLDFFYAQKHAANRMLRNDLVSGNRWIKVSLRAPNGQRHPHGARVYLYEIGGLGDDSRRVAWWELRSQDGYLSQQDGVVHIGAGARQRIAVRVVFLGGATVDYPDVPTNSWVAVGMP